MSPKELIKQWVVHFNNGDANALAELYHADAINHQVVWDPIEGRENIKMMFEKDFSRAQMTCVIENIFEDGEWGILEWKDPLGLRGCGFFQIVDEKIKFQRGYWDHLSFTEQQGFPKPE
ncbi:nuclear transport factor 2 family protein [Marinoscillum sp. MHG1-6]|uniref:nuclear transport factor 2 family protein n=1 Tax=Marinoscillum sp. MHG1-6 TaxID=2959627 RepID=UPI0021573107|nr:nuclear transport factor 2 family protein [Marinoscillum sp. MHG1-6]